MTEPIKEKDESEFIFKTVQMKREDYEVMNRARKLLAEGKSQFIRTSVMLRARAVLRQFEPDKSSDNNQKEAETSHGKQFDF